MIVWSKYNDPSLYVGGGLGGSLVSVFMVCSPTGGRYPGAAVEGGRYVGLAVVKVGLGVVYIGLGVVGGGIYAVVGGKIVDEIVFDDAGGKYGIPGFRPLPLEPGRYIPATSLPDENESVSTKLF